MAVRPAQFASERSGHKAGICAALPCDRQHFRGEIEALDLVIAKRPQIRAGKTGAAAGVEEGSRTAWNISGNEARHNEGRQ